jgi:hypothetical protein
MRRQRETESSRACFFRCIVPLIASVPSKIFEGPYTWSLPASAGRLYDVSRKSGRFLMMKSEPDQQAHNVPDTIVVVQNWIEELKQKLPAR